MLDYFSSPLSGRIERAVACHVVDQDESVRVLRVHLVETVEPFLACGVPHIELDSFLFHGGRRFVDHCVNRQLPVGVLQFLGINLFLFFLGHRPTISVVTAARVWTTAYPIKRALPGQQPALDNEFNMLHFNHFSLEKSGHCRQLTLIVIVIQKPLQY